MDLSEEKELVERARGEKVFGKLYDQYYSLIFGYVLKRGVANTGSRYGNAGCRLSVDVLGIVLGFSSLQNNFSASNYIDGFD